ncbi:hypothetical protein LUZ60_012979 [Juncus effusus]|nr:hypothetical protein LUZ60_012979 [Juncus effusus]
MQMQLTRERSFSSPTISTLIQNAPSQDIISSSHLSDLSSSLKIADVSQSQKHKLAHEPNPKKTLLDTTPDQIQSKKIASPKEKSERSVSEAKGGKNRKGLRRCSTFPRSKVHAEEDETVTEQKSNLHDKEPVSSEQPSYQRSISVPHSFRLKSALKGSRAQDGISPRSCDMHVRWAPDVYDPPVTSSSHTVQKGRPSSSKGKKKGKKKDNNNSRKKKGKKSERKCAIESSRSGSIESSESAIETSGDKTLICESDVKCGSEFLRESLSKMHFSTAEAS